jgi:hypothetical protein
MKMREGSGLVPNFKIIMKDNFGSDSIRRRMKAKQTGTMGRALAAALIASLALSACASDMIPASRRARSHKPKAPPPNGVNSVVFRQCAGRLANMGVQFETLPDRSFSGGCTAYGAVKLLDIGVPTTNLSAMTCPLAQNFAAWVRYGVRPAARLYLGSDVVRVDSFGTYSCRTVAGSGRLSEHARANAVDVAAFLLADGRRISVQNGWDSDEASRIFLRTVRDSACKRFPTVLSPDYNAAHHDHLHFDMGGKGGYCR